MSLESPSSLFWLLPITLTNSDPHTHTLLSLCVCVLSSVCALVIRYATGAAGAAIHQGMESGIAKTFDHRAGRQGQLWFAGQAEKGEQNRTGTGKSFVPVLTSPAASVVFHTLIEWLSRYFTPTSPSPSPHPRPLSQEIRKGLLKAAKTTGAWIFTGGTNTGKLLRFFSRFSYTFLLLLLSSFHLSFMTGHYDFYSRPLKR